MEGNDDLELSDQDPGTGSTQSVRKNISIKLKPSPNKGRGKIKKGTRSSSKKPSKKPVEPEERDDVNKDLIPLLDDSLLHDEVLHLSVAAIKPNNSLQPLHKSQRLSWDHKVNLIGDKVVDPLIHCCEKCELPILIYGRMIPCKHVFCFECARKNEQNKVCPRCVEPFQRIEQSALGTVFVCTYGGTKHGVSGCRRTYLSPRDLKAHIDHRHLKQLQGEQQRAAIPEYKTHSGVVAMDVQQHIPPPPPPQQQQALPQSQHGHHEAYLTRQPTGEDQRHIHHVPPPPAHAHHLPPPQPHQTAPPPPHPQSHPPLPHASTLPPPPPQHHQPQHAASTVESYQTIPVMTTSRSGNLITIPIQDESRPYRGRHGDKAQQQKQQQQQQQQQPPPPPQQQQQQPSMAYPPPPQGHQPPPAPYVPQAPPPQQYHTAHPPPPHSSGPPYSNPPPGPYTGSQHHNQQGVLPPMSHTHPPLSQPPPMTSSAPMTLPSHHGPPPPHQPLPHQQPPAGPPPPRYSSSHPHYEDQHPRTPPYMSQGGHSPRTPWGSNQPRGPPPPRGPSPNSSMPPPRTDTGHYKQYYQ